MLVGKIAASMCDHFGWNSYTWPTGSEFRDGYVDQQVAVIQELFSRMELKEVTDTSDEMLRVHSSGPTRLPMADLVNKGTFSNIRITFATTNTTENVDSFLVDRRAFARRVAARFRKTGTDQLRVISCTSPLQFPTDPATGLYLPVSGDQLFTWCVAEMHRRQEFFDNAIGDRFKIVPLAVEGPGICRLPLRSPARRATRASSLASWTALPPLCATSPWRRFPPSPPPLRPPGRSALRVLPPLVR
jgi:hypothetical protein